VTRHCDAHAVAFYKPGGLARLGFVALCRRRNSNEPQELSPSLPFSVSLSRGGSASSNPTMWLADQVGFFDLLERM
jgi:hypothetical protein